MTTRAATEHFGGTCWDLDTLFQTGTTSTSISKPYLQAYQCQIMKLFTQILVARSLLSLSHPEEPYRDIFQL